MRIGIFAVLCLPAALYAQPVPAVSKVKPLPDFTIVASTWPPYGFVPNCSPGEPAIIFHLTVHNIGQTASTAVNDLHAVWVQDNANPSWAGGATLPAIPSWGTATVFVPLVALKTPNAMDGHHQFTATVNGAKSVAELNYNNDTLLIDVNFPAGFCGPVVATTTASGTTVTPHSTTPQPGAQVTPVTLGGGLPAPTNLNNTITQAVCTKYGGPAAALACSAALPAGKLVLVWDYPYPNPVDGYHVYVTKFGGSTPVLQNVVSPKPAATQTAPGVRLAILDPPPAGTCYAVTAFQGTKESQQSATSFCVSESNLPKTTTFNADQTFTMFKEVIVDWDQHALDTSNQVGEVHDSWAVASVGAERDPMSPTRPDGPSTNYVFRGYVHFKISSLAGHQIAKAQLQLHGGSTKGSATGCVTQYGAAPAWKAGFIADIDGRHYAASTLQGPDLDLDVTPIVQSWASSPAANTAFELTDDTDPASPKLVQLKTTCVTSYKTGTLKVTYY